MPERVDSLLDRISLGEDSTLGLKEVVFSGSEINGPTRDSLGDELAAFANAHGGTLVLGVRDSDREIIGIPLDRLDDVERMVHETLHDAIDPALQGWVRRTRLADSLGISRAVLQVEISSGLSTHRGPSGYLLRVGSSKREMSPDELVRLIRQRSQPQLIQFDANPVQDASFTECDPALMDRFRTPRTTDDRHALARKVGMATTLDTGQARLTVAGVLLGTARPDRWLPEAFIQAVAYRGNSVVPDIGQHDYQIDAADITGPLDLQIAGACHFVAKNQKIAATKDIGRRDLPQYDMTAIFEAVANAVAHRDYSVRSKVRLRMFTDRLELYVPGSLAGTMTLQSLPHRQIDRNSRVTSLLAKIPVPADVSGLQTSRITMMDRRGEGVQIILERSQRISGRMPVYETLDGSELRLVIFASGTDRTVS